MYQFHWKQISSIDSKEKEYISKFISNIFNLDISLQNTHHIGLIKYDNKIIGVGCLKWNQTYKYSHIYNVGISKNHRGKKLCHKIIQYIMNQKIENFQVNQYPITLYVRTDSNNVNIPAIKCYKKHNFILQEKNKYNLPNKRIGNDRHIETLMVYMPKRNNQKIETFMIDTNGGKNKTIYFQLFIILIMISFLSLIIYMYCKLKHTH